MAKKKPEVKAVPVDDFDRKWRIERDANLLKEHQELLSDKGRHKEAVNKLKQDMQCLQKVVNKVQPKPTKKK